MGLDKNTISISQIDTIISVLKDLHVPFTLNDIANVQGRGLNDLCSDSSCYTLRRLCYADKVVLETMEYHSDCDTDDLIQSYKFDKDKEPEKWPITNEIQDFEIT